MQLRDNNTCPVCRLQLPEEGEAEAQEGSRPAGTADAAAGGATGYANWTGQGRPRAPSAYRAAQPESSQAAGEDVDEEALLQRAIQESLAGHPTPSASTQTASAAIDRQRRASTSSAGSSGEDVEELVRQTLENMATEDLRDQCRRDQLDVPASASRDDMVEALLHSILRPSETESSTASSAPPAVPPPTAPSAPPSAPPSRTVDNFLREYAPPVEPSEDSNEEVVTLKVRTPAGTFVRKFTLYTTVMQVVAAALAHAKDKGVLSGTSHVPRMRFMTLPDRTEVENWFQTLAESGIGARGQVSLETI